MAIYYNKRWLPSSFPPKTVTMYEQLKWLSLLVLQSYQVWLGNREISEQELQDERVFPLPMIRSEPLGKARQSQRPPALGGAMARREASEPEKSGKDTHMVGNNANGPAKGIGTQSDKKGIVPKE